MDPVTRVDRAIETLARISRGAAESGRITIGYPFTSIILADRIDRVRGGVRIRRAGRARYLVERYDLDGVYAAYAGFRTYLQARAQFLEFADRI
jgi:hypothetical protein